MDDKDTKEFRFGNEKFGGSYKPGEFELKFPNELSSEEFENMFKERLESLKGSDGKKIVTAHSVEDLLVKIQNAAFELRSNNVMTEQEKLVGQKFDFSV